MTSLTFYGAVKEIGGNKILLEDKGTKIFLDFGMSFGKRGQFFEEFLTPRTAAGIKDFLAMDLIPDIKGVYRDDLLTHMGRKAEEPDVQGVILSHAHADHANYISFLHEKIPIHCGETAKRILDAIQESITIYDPMDVWNEIKKSCRIEINNVLLETMLFRTYTTCVVFLGKINNAYERKNIPLLFDNCVGISHQFIHIILATNNLTLNSWKNVHKRIKDAKLKPDNFWEKFSYLMGYNNEKRDPKRIVDIAHTLTRDFQQLINSVYGDKIKDKNFKEILNYDLENYRIE